MTSDSIRRPDNGESFTPNAPPITLKHRVGNFVLPRLPITRFLFEQLRLEFHAAFNHLANSLLPHRRWRLRKLRRRSGLRVNVACGASILEDFINLDLFHKDPRVLLWNCRRRLPLADESAVGIRVEHFLEHLEPRQELPAFLKDCFRVLQPGGVLRIIVPAAERFLRAYCADGREVFRELNFPEPFPHDLPTRMDIANHIFHQWHEHRWAYDFETLAHRLESAGFSRPAQTSFGKSLDDALAQDREIHAPYSLYVDAIKGNRSTTAGDAAREITDQDVIRTVSTTPAAYSMSRAGAPDLGPLVGTGNGVNRRVIQRVLREYRKRLWLVYSFFRQTVTCTTRQGIFALSTGVNDPINRFLYVDREYERDLFVGAMDLIREVYEFPRGRGAVLDIGANNGVIGIGMIVTGEVERAIAIEPEPRNFSFLERNVKLNHLEGVVTCMNLAVSDNPSSLHFELSETNSGDHRVRKPRLHRQPKELCNESERQVITVPADTVDNVLSRVDETLRRDISVAWVDVQGYEGFVFLGGKQFFSSGIPAVAEIWPYGLQRVGMSSQYFCSIVGDIWTVYWVRRGTRFIRHPIDMLYTYFDELGYDGAFGNVIFTQ